jgi:hypothetical protein
MTCLSIVQTVTARLGLNSPTAVVTSVDPQIRQLLALLNEEGQTLAEATNWQSLTVEASFNTVAAEVQGPLSTIAPGCKFIVNDTIWNRSLRMPVFGPLVAQTWQQQKAMYLQGPWNQFRVVNDQIKFLPIPPAGQSCYFEYITKNWTSGGTDTFTDDAQTSLLDESVMVMGLIWRFRQAKGLDYSADLEKYLRRVSDFVGRETPKPMLDMGDSFNDIPPVVILPAGSWGV